MSYLTHIALQVKDPNRSAQFYARYCDLQITHRRKDPDPNEPSKMVEVIWLANHEALRGFVIVLIQGEAKSTVGTSFHHLGFDLPNREAVDKIAQQADAEGILAIKAQDAGEIVGYLCGISDPDGNLIEFSYGQVIAPPDYIQMPD